MKPNVLFIHCHDLGDHLGCYPGTSARTPNLDRLLAEDPDEMEDLAPTTLDVAHRTDAQLKGIVDYESVAQRVREDNVDSFVQWRAETEPQDYELDARIEAWLEQEGTP